MSDDHASTNGGPQDLPLSMAPADRRRIRDRAVILPAVGLILLLPPFAGIFALDIRVAGAPFTALYLFAVWAALIIGAALLSRGLGDLDRAERRDTAGGEGDG